MTQERPLRAVVLGASPSEHSKSEALAELAVNEVRGPYPAEVTRINVYRLGVGFTSAITREDADDATTAALAAVEGADLLIVAIPVFRGSFPGLFKHFLDLVDQYALVRKPVLLMATGGSDRHALVIDDVLRPLFGFFHAFVAPMGVYASSAAFDGATVLDPGLYTRVQLAVADLAPLLTPRAVDAATLAAPGSAA